MAHPTIYQHYSEDHDRLDELFRQFQARKSEDRAGAAGIFREFRAGLERHVLRAKGILFPEFETKIGMATGPTEVMRWEHRQFRGFLDAIVEKLARDDFDTAAEEACLLSVLGPHNKKGRRHPVSHDRRGYRSARARGDLRRDGQARLNDSPVPACAR